MDTRNTLRNIFRNDNHIMERLDDISQTEYRRPKIIAKPLPKINSTNFAIGGFIYTKGGELDQSRYDNLSHIINENSCTLLVDIDTCKTLIYPIYLNIFKNSTQLDVYRLVVKALLEVDNFDIPCRTETSMHTYNIIKLDKQDRYIYI